MCLRAAPAAAPAVGGAAHAALHRSWRRIAGRVPLAPPELLRGLREVLPPHRVGRLGRQVLHPERDRVHPDLVGELVHQQLGGIAPLRMAGRPHRARRPGVRVDVLVASAPVRERVDVGDREAGADAGAARAVALRVERDAGAVGRDAGLDLRGRGGAIASGEVLFLAIEHQLHRRAGQLRQLRADDALGVGPELAAEAAAHVLADRCGRSPAGSAAPPRILRGCRARPASRSTR